MTALALVDGGVQAVEWEVNSQLAATVLKPGCEYAKDHEVNRCESKLPVCFQMTPEFRARSRSSGFLGLV